MKSKIFILAIYIIFNTNLFSQWEILNWPIDDPRDLFFSDSLNGLMTGYGSPVLTSDGGDSWFYSENDDFAVRGKLKFLNDSCGYAINYYVFRQRI